MSKTESNEKGGEPKKAYSSKLMQMRFMQRSRAKPAAAAEVKEEEVAVKEDPDAEGEWIRNGAGASEAGCTVIMEGDPPPGASSGRMSFQGFNVDTEKAGTAAKIKREEEENPGGRGVSDEEMTRQLAPSPPPKRRKSGGTGGPQERFTTPRNDTRGRYFA